MAARKQPFWADCVTGLINRGTQKIGTKPLLLHYVEMVQFISAEAGTEGYIVYKVDRWVSHDKCSFTLHVSENIFLKSFQPLNANFKMAS